MISGLDIARNKKQRDLFMFTCAHARTHTYAPPHPPHHAVCSTTKLSIRFILRLIRTLEH